MYNFPYKNMPKFYLSLSYIFENLAPGFFQFLLSLLELRMLWIFLILLRTFLFEVTVSIISVLFSLQPLSDGLGGWPWSSRQEGGLAADEKYKYSLTSLSRPRVQCLGFARQRVGRGGRLVIFIYNMKLFCRGGRLGIPFWYMLFVLFFVEVVNFVARN